MEEERELKSPSLAARDSHAPTLHGSSDGYGLDLSLFYPFSFFVLYFSRGQVSGGEDVKVRILGFTIMLSIIQRV